MILLTRVFLTIPLRLNMPRLTMRLDSSGAQAGGCALAKTDVRNAFRLIPINPCDYDLLGFVGRTASILISACR